MKLVMAALARELPYSADELAVLERALRDDVADERARSAALVVIAHRASYTNRSLDHVLHEWRHARAELS